MRRFWDAAAITPIYITSNCSRRNWNGNERLPRRGSSRKGLRLAAFAAADDLFAAVSLECRLRGHIDVTGRPPPGGGPLPVRVWRGQVHRPRHESYASGGGCLARRQPGFARFSRRVAAELRRAV